MGLHTTDCGLLWADQDQAIATIGTSVGNIKDVAKALNEALDQSNQELEDLNDAVAKTHARTEAIDEKTNNLTSGGNKHRMCGCAVM